MWLCNKGGDADKLVGAGTPNEASVDVVDVRQVIRGGDVIKFTLRFEKAGSADFNIQSQLPDYDESPSPTR